ncbi:MAG: tRNA (adenosine(37)-N6)-threonylcarbamoyltransferase complex ATPase subunit type 1 TsaE [Thermoleophilia bacterium]
MLRANLSSLAQTRSLGCVLAAWLQPPAVVTLRGELGSGKTTLVREIGRALGVAEVIVSPSYTLAQSYQGRDGLTVHHLDLYRLGAGSDVDLFAWDDYLGQALTFVEWPEAGAAQLPSAVLDLELVHVSRRRRRALLRVAPSREEDLLHLLRAGGVTAALEPDRGDSP